MTDKPERNPYISVVRQNDPEPATVSILLFLMNIIISVAAFK